MSRHPGMAQPDRHVEASQDEGVAKGVLVHFVRRGVGAGPGTPHATIPTFQLRARTPSSIEVEATWRIR
jgi:hypothetical protein